MLVVSIIMQIAAAVLALSYMRKTMNTTWFFIVGALLLMGMRRFLSLADLGTSSAISEIVALVISAMMLVGIFFIAQIFKQYHENIAHMKSLQDIDRTILSSLSLKGMMNAIIAKLNSALDTDAMALFTVDKHSRELVTCASHNFHTDIEKRIKSDTDGYISWIIENRKPVIIPKITDNESEGFLKKLKSEGFASYIGSPVTVRGSMPVGVLTLYSKNPKRYTKQELEFIKAVSSQIAIALDRAQLVERMKEMGVESVRALVEAIEIRDPYTRGHSHQVANLAVKLGMAMGLTDRELNLIEFAGLLHDVGKIAVPEDILQKKAKLTSDEWDVMKKHPIHSAKIIEPVLNLRYITNWILHHHERWDGLGYPAGRQKEEIPLQSRILAVCDTYSAMTESRPYRSALTVEATRAEIERVAGTQLDPTIAHAFLNLNVGDINGEFSSRFEGGSSRLVETIHTSSGVAGASNDEPQLL
ncbi:MAG: HD domain-containing protein [candidate division WOR-3 bacterium]|nr:MAG: HD domain-containing protein [candidate division WOR-3 bacterium]